MGVARARPCEKLDGNCEARNSQSERGGNRFLKGWSREIAIMGSMTNREVEERAENLRKALVSCGPENEGQLISAALRATLLRAYEESADAVCGWCHSQYHLEYRNKPYVYGGGGKVYGWIHPLPDGTEVQCQAAVIHTMKSSLTR